MEAYYGSDFLNVVLFGCYSCHRSLHCSVELYGLDTNLACKRRYGHQVSPPHS